VKNKTIRYMQNYHQDSCTRRQKIQGFSRPFIQ